LPLVIDCQSVMHSTDSVLVPLLQVVQYIVNAWANGGGQMNS